MYRLKDIEMLRAAFVIMLFLLRWSLGFSQVQVTFTVDIPDLEIAPGGVHIAGQFNTVQSVSITSDWNLAAPGSRLNLITGNTYSVAVEFSTASIGKTMLFQFSRDSAWANANGDISEGNPNECCLNTSCAEPGGAGGFDRKVVIPSCGGEYKCVWNQCGQLVPVAPPFLNLSPGNQLVCKGDTIQLLAKSDGTVQWKPNTSLSCVQCVNPLAWPLSKTWYVAWSAKANCIVKDSMRIDPQVPFLQLPDDTLVCIGKSIVLQSAGNGTFNWSPPEGLSCTGCLYPRASPIKATVYHVNMRLGSCVLKDSLRIDVDTHFVDAGPDKTILYGEKVELKAIGPGPYSWSPISDVSCPDCASPQASPENTTRFRVKSVSPHGCQVTDSTTVYVKSVCEQVFFPNLLTPNGDARNEHFTLASITNKATCRLVFERFKVFNRWGISVFDTNDPNFSWPSEDANSGIYFYTISFSEQKWNGWLQVLK